MTLQDVIVRDMLRNRQASKDESLDAYNNKEEARMRKRVWWQVVEVVGAVLTFALTFAMFVFLGWCFLALTPNQTSAEADACRMEMGIGD